MKGFGCWVGFANKSSGGFQQVKVSHLRWLLTEQQRHTCVTFSLTVFVAVVLLDETRVKLLFCQNQTPMRQLLLLKTT